MIHLIKKILYFAVGIICLVRVHIIWKTLNRYEDIPLNTRSTKLNSKSKYIYLTPLNKSFDLNSFKYTNITHEYDYSGPKLKKILFYHNVPNFGITAFGGIGQDLFNNFQCEINTCFITHNRKMFSNRELDAVIFQVTPNLINDITSLGKDRSEHTRYVFATRKPGIALRRNWHLFKYVNNVFNWTMTIHRKADFYFPHARVYTKNIEFPNPDIEFEYDEGINYGGNKDKMIAWAVSNCHALSNRNLYTHTLRHYIQVDIFGKCGAHNCSKTEDGWTFIEEHYKFYLAFENSVCEDYITEKFFYTLQYNIIPIVYGFGPYDEVAPPHSYIDIQNYKSPKELAQYLLYLDKNDDAYNEYFKWKKYHIMMNTEVAAMIPLCELCERLHTDENKKIIPNIYRWFDIDNTCHDKTEPGMHSFIESHFGLIYKYM